MLPCTAPGFARGKPLLEGTFLSRPNRFLAIVRLGSSRDMGDRTESGRVTEGRESEVDGPEVEAHVADPGRLKELLIPGRRVYLAPAGARSRKTVYDLVLVDADGRLVSLDSRVPNEVMYEALRTRFFDGLAGYPEITREARYRKSRLDFRLSGRSLPDCFIEVKSVTLVREERALFPPPPSCHRP